MTVAALNRADPHAAVDAHEDSLAEAYEAVLRAAGRTAATRFRKLGALSAAADPEDPAHPNWAPPNIDELVDLGLIAKQTSAKTTSIRLKALHDVQAGYEAQLGQPAFDITNPASVALAQGFEARAGDVAKSVRDDLQKTITNAYQQGFSVDKTAAQIVAQSDQFSKFQARMLARTDLNGIANGGSVMAARTVGVGYKTWLATEDEKTRETHSEADGQTVPIDQSFTVGGEQADYPGDPSLSDEEACNCRCTVTYSDSGGDAGQTAAGPLESGTLYIARHGLTAYDSDNQATDTIRGWADDPLTPEGEAEAHTLAAALDGLGITQLSSSDLIRAAETGRIIAETLGLHNTKTGLLRCWDVGDLQGQTSEAAANEIAEYVDNPGTPIPNGESFDSFASRFVAALSEAMLPVAGGENVLLVTHSHNLKLARDWLTNGYELPGGEEFAVPSPGPVSVLVCRPNGSGWDVTEAAPEDPAGVVPGWANYRSASDPEFSCGTCVFFEDGECEMFGAPVEATMVCDEFEPAGVSQAPGLSARIGGAMPEAQITIPLNITVGQANSNRQEAGMIISTKSLAVRPSMVPGLGPYTIDGLPFQATGSTDLPLSDRNLAWDAAAAQKSLQPADFPKAHFWKDPDGPADQITSYKFPFAKRINGELTAVWKGVTAGAQRLSSAKGVDTGAIEKKMGAYYRKAATQFKDPTIKAPFKATQEPHDPDPLEHHAYMDDGSGQCVWCGMSAGAKVHGKVSPDALDGVVATALGAPTWRAVLCVEGEPTEDGRLLAPGSITWRELPLSLMCQTETAPGHDGAEVCGRIDSIYRDGNLIIGEGIFDAGAFGLEAARLVSEQVLRGISIDLAVLDYEMRPAVAGDESALDIGDEDMIVPEPTDELFVVLDGVIGAATICPFQAIANATIEVLTSDAAFKILRVSSPFTLEEPLTASAVEAEAPLRPPAEWFDNPELDKPTLVTVTDDGRVFGHVAPWRGCHTGYLGRCVPPPRSRSGYAGFHVGRIETAEGDLLPIGKLTLASGHADLSLNTAAARAHYDNTSRVVAFVRAGEDAHGIWVAGSLRPGTPPSMIQDLLANPLSGDWRNGEMVAAHAVPVPGFPILQASAIGEEGEEQTALILTSTIGMSEEAPDLALRSRVLAARARGGLEALAELAHA